MFVLRPRLLYSGCYISKTTYVRPGENSFQDANYKPWHVVNYFRYLRFFSSGLALMLTTADSPNVMIGHLKKYGGRHSAIMRGFFSLQGNVVIAIFKRKSPPPENLVRFRKKKNENNNNGSNVQEQIFQIVNMVYYTCKKLFITFSGWT